MKNAALHTTVSFCFFTVLALFASATSAQTTGGATRKQKAEIRKAKYTNDFNHFGVDVELFRPQLVTSQPTNRINKGINVTLSFLEMGFMQTNAPLFTTTFMEPTFGGQFNFPTDFFIRQNYYGLNIPLPFLGFGAIGKFPERVRMHPIALVRFGKNYITSTPSVNKGATGAAYTFGYGLGYRVRTPFVTAELRYMNTHQFWSEEVYEAGLIPRYGYTSLVLRMDGMFEVISPRFKTVNATRVSTSAGPSKTTTRKDYNYSNNTVKTTTTTVTPYTVRTSPGKTVVTDIGGYGGIGLRYSRALPSSYHYSNSGGLLGLQSLFRKGSIVGGLNIEGGRIGHASVMEGKPDDYSKTRILKSRDFAQGSINTFNFLFDLGADCTSFLYAAGGTVYDGDDATPFSSLNVGYSFGFHGAWGQRFDDPNAAIRYIETAYVEKNKWNDARESGFGYLGVWWIGLDMGNVGLRTSWYRYRGAPLANNLMIGLSWRLGSGN